MKSTEVVARAAENVKELANDLDVSLGRMYEILSTDNPYPKLWRVLEAIGRRNPDGLRAIQADFNARCAQILGTKSAPVTTAQAHREFSEAVQSWLDGKDVDTQRRELLEAATVIQRRLDDLNRLSNSDPDPDQCSAAAH